MVQSTLKVFSVSQALHVECDPSGAFSFWQMAPTLRDCFRMLEFCALVSR
jgi:hypothetical protein